MSILCKCNRSVAVEMLIPKIPAINQAKQGRRILTSKLRELVPPPCLSNMIVRNSDSAITTYTGLGMPPIIYKGAVNLFTSAYTE